MRRRRDAAAEAYTDQETITEAMENTFGKTHLGVPKEGSAYHEYYGMVAALGSFQEYDLLESFVKKVWALLGCKQVRPVYFVLFLARRAKKRG